MRVTMAISVAGALALVTTTACRVFSPDECMRFVDCAAHTAATFDRETNSNIEEQFGEAGTCWQSNDANVYATCAAICADGNATAKASLEAAAEELGPCE